MTEDQAQAILDDLEHNDQASIDEAMRVLDIAQDPQEREVFDALAWQLEWFRAMFKLGIAIIVVEGIAFAIMTANHAYYALPIIPWTMATMGFIVGKGHERRKQHRG